MKGDPQTYDTSEGFGSPESWRAAFHARLTEDEIDRILKGRDPYEVLGIQNNASTDTAKSAYRKLCLQFHPDKNPNGTEQFQLVQAAWQRIGG